VTIEQVHRLENAAEIIRNLKRQSDELTSKISRLTISDSVNLFASSDSTKSIRLEKKENPKLFERIIRDIEMAFMDERRERDLAIKNFPESYVEKGDK